MPPIIDHTLDVARSSWPQFLKQQVGFVALLEPFHEVTQHLAKKIGKTPDSGKYRTAFQVTKHFLPENGAFGILQGHPVVPD
jgi:hypothetical protein